MIYVDPAIWPHRGERWAHLISDSSYDELHAWSVRHRAEYWSLTIERLGVRFAQPFHAALDLSHSAVNGAVVSAG